MDDEYICHCSCGCDLGLWDDENYICDPCGLGSHADDSGLLAY